MPTIFAMCRNMPNYMSEIRLLRARNFIDFDQEERHISGIFRILFPGARGTNFNQAFIYFHKAGHHRIDVVLDHEFLAVRAATGRSIGSCSIDADGEEGSAPEGSATHPHDDRPASDGPALLDTAQPPRQLPKT